jgi:hypothetical protein
MIIETTYVLYLAISVALTVWVARTLYVTLALKLGDKPVSTQEAIEFLSTKVGLVLLVLGAMHFFNVFVIAKWGKRAAGAIRV